MADMNNFVFVTLTKAEPGMIDAYLNIGTKKKKKPKKKRAAQLHSLVQFDRNVTVMDISMYIIVSISNRMKDWKKELMPELVQCVVATARRGTGGKRSTDNKIIARTFYLIVFQGRLRSAVRMATSCDGDCVYLP